MKYYPLFESYLVLAWGLCREHPKIEFATLLLMNWIYEPTLCIDDVQYTKPMQKLTGNPIKITKKVNGAVKTKKPVCAHKQALRFVHDLRIRSASGSLYFGANNSFNTIQKFLGTKRFRDVIINASNV